MLVIAAVTLSLFVVPAQAAPSSQPDKESAPYQQTSARAEGGPARREEKKSPAGHKYYILGNGNSFRKPERAVEYYRTAIENGYDTADLRVELGKLLYRLERYEESAEHYRAAVEMDGKDVRARLGLAYGLLARGRHQEALEEFEVLKAIAPEDYRAGILSSHIGACLEAVGRYEEALKEYEAALRCDCHDAADEERIRSRVETIKTLRTPR